MWNLCLQVRHQSHSEMNILLPHGLLPLGLPRHDGQARGVQSSALASPLRQSRHTVDVTQIWDVNIPTKIQKCFDWLLAVLKLHIHQGLTCHCWWGLWTFLAWTSVADDAESMPLTGCCDLMDETVENDVTCRGKVNWASCPWLKQIVLNWPSGFSRRLVFSRQCPFFSRHFNLDHDANFKQLLWSI